MIKLSSHRSEDTDYPSCYLSNEELDTAVSKIVGYNIHPSIEWKDCGLLIEKYRMLVEPRKLPPTYLTEDDQRWFATIPHYSAGGSIYYGWPFAVSGKTPQEAVSRAVLVFEREEWQSSSTGRYIHRDFYPTT